MLPALLLLAQAASDRDALVQGVGPLVAPGALPGAMVASKGAFVVLQSLGKPVVVAGRVGAGRALDCGHGAFFGPGPLQNPANARFLGNALAWLGGKPLSRLRVGTLGMDRLDDWARRAGADVIAVGRDGIAGQLLGVDVLAMGQDALGGDLPAQAAVVAWVRAGHGLLLTGPAWGWQQLNPTKDLVRDLAANRMLLPYGLGSTGETADGAPGPQGADDPLLQTDSALAALERGSLAGADAARASVTVSRALSLAGPDAALAARIMARAERENPGDAFPMTDRMPFSHLRAALEYRAWEAAPPEGVRAHPSAADFPGPVPTAARRTTRSVTVDTRVPDWHGLGLYAAPGEVVRVTLPAGAAAKGLGLRIGSHTDELWGLPKSDRFPAISRRWPLDADTTAAASPFGGTVYLDVPAGCALGTVAVVVAGAVPAPRFVRGVTTTVDWARQMAEPGGPWIDLEGHHIILSVPRSACESLKDPEPLMAFWDETFERARELYAAPARPRPERYCVDRQISGGYMHSGYPIMTFEDVARTFTDVGKLRGKGATWGFFHELGHNFQEGDWTFEGTGEVTNNLFSLYASERLDGVAPADYGIAHPAMSPEEQRKRLAAYLARGARFEEWKADPFLALTMYAQVREAFGWEPFTKAFAQYRLDPTHPATDDAKRDLWMVRLSRTTGRNLGPFFVAWGVPTGEAARRSVADLPSWMPADWPG